MRGEDDRKFGVEMGLDELEQRKAMTRETDPAPPPDDMVPPEDRKTPLKDDLLDPVTVGQTIEIVENAIRNELAPVLRKIEILEKKKELSKAVLDRMSEKFDDVFGLLMGKIDENGERQGGLRKEFEKFDGRVAALQSTADQTSLRLQQHATEMSAMIGNEYLALVESNRRLRHDLDELKREVEDLKRDSSDSQHQEQ